MKDATRFIIGMTQCCAWVAVTGAAALGLQILLAMVFLGKYAVAISLLKSLYN